MAEIDKGLPNTRNKEELPSQEEIQDVADAVKEVGNQVGDVAKAVKGKPRTGRKPRAKKTKK